MMIANCAVARERTVNLPAVSVAGNRGRVKSSFAIYQICIQSKQKEIEGCNLRHHGLKWLSRISACRATHVTLLTNVAVHLFLGYGNFHRVDTDVCTGLKDKHVSIKCNQFLVDNL